MKLPYVIWAQKKVKSGCMLSELSGFDDGMALRRGNSLSRSFPGNVVFKMNPDFPHNTVMTDNMGNTSMLIIGSGRLKAFLESKAPASVEYLPVAIQNHKGKIVSRDYSIIHTVNPVDCLDVEKSQAEWEVLAKDVIRKVERLVIDASKIEENRLLFRPRHFYRIALVRRDLAEEIDREGFTGVRWIELNDYPEI